MEQKGIFIGIESDDMESSKRHAVLLSLIFLLKCFSKSFFIKINYTSYRSPWKRDSCPIYKESKNYM